MKKHLILCMMACLLAACGMPAAHQINVIPATPDAAYDTMVLALQELGWAITHTDKASRVILADRITSGEVIDQALGGDAAKPLKASIQIQDQGGQSSVSIQVTWPGYAVKSSVPDKNAKKIMEVFHRRLNGGVTP